MPKSPRTKLVVRSALLGMISALSVLPPANVNALESQAGNGAGLVLDKVKVDPNVTWTVSADGTTASMDGQWGHQEINFPAPSAIPPNGATFTWTLIANATVSNLATECEVHASGLIATATPGLHASAFSEAPGKLNTRTVTVNLKPSSTSPGATADLQVGCFSNFSVHFLYKSAAATTTSTTTTSAPQSCGRRSYRSQVDGTTCGVRLSIISPTRNSHAEVQPGTQVQLQSEVVGYPLPFTVVLKYRSGSSGPFFAIPGKGYRCQSSICAFPPLGYTKPTGPIEFQAVVLDGSSVLFTAEGVYATWVRPDELTFDYAVPDRYGLDSDNDGLVDEPTDAQARPVDWPVDLTVTDCPNPDPAASTYTWNYTNAAGTTKPLPATWTSKCTWRALFPGPGRKGGTNGEGAFKVSLKVDVKRPEEHHYVATREVVVQDWLILGLGDSLASGEGNPLTGPGGIAIWQSRQCDRSHISYQAQVAAKLEASDPKTSVTFVHLACSGAKAVDHSPRGTAADNSVADGGLLDRYEGVNPRDGSVLPPQIEQAKNRVGGREVDAILLSIGVNDMEFGPVVLSCSHAGVSHGASINGDCFGQPYTNNAGEPFPNMAQFLRFTSAGELPALYKKLNERFVSTFGGPFPKGGLPTDRVFIPDYPDTIHDVSGALCAELDLSATGTTPDRWDGWVRTDEVRQLGTEFLTPLNAQLARTGAPATANKPFSWNSISITDPAGRGFEKKGYCAANRLVRQRDESFTVQGNQNGTLHPNEAGHRWIADIVYQVVRSKLYPTGTARRPV